jgi:hypothetical protein
MDRRQLESAGANYPFYSGIQGLYGIPLGLMYCFVALSNTSTKPLSPWAVGGGVLLGALAFWAVNRYYQHRFGVVTPTRSRKVRTLVAAGAGFGVYIVAYQLARAVLGQPPRQPVSTMAATFALGMVVFYAMNTGLKAHHIVIWGSLLVAGLMPIWGLDVNRDAIAYFQIGAASVASGLLDHRLLVRTFKSYQVLDLENTHAGS